MASGTLKNIRDGAALNDLASAWFLGKADIRSQSMNCWIVTPHKYPARPHAAKMRWVGVLAGNLPRQCAAGDSGFSSRLSLLDAMLTQDAFPGDVS
jgi:hypothetical protein